MTGESPPVSYTKPKAIADAKARSIDERFAEFHEANPEVYRELVALVNKSQVSGPRRIGIRMVWEVMRWERMLRTTPNTKDDFKLNDHFHSRYARMILDNEPELAGVFELREIRS